MRKLIIALLWSGSALAQTIAYPGQSGNPIGYLGCPVSPGLNAAACPPHGSSGSAGSPIEIKNCTYSTAQTISQSFIWFENVDFQAGTSGTQVTGSNNLFWCSRFQSNQTQFYNVNEGGSNNVFLFDSFTPLASLYTNPPGNANNGNGTYPLLSAGSGSNSTTETDDVNVVAVNKGYQFGINISGISGPLYVDSADFWGFANCVQFANSTTQVQIYTNLSCHDSAQYSGVLGGDYHPDGIGYLNGTAAPSNISEIGTVQVMLGDSNSVAYQAASSGYDKINMIGNIVSGDGNTVSYGDIAPQHITNSSAIFNVLSTAIMPIFGPFHGVTLGAGTFWGCNKISFFAGTTWVASNGGWTPTSGMDGKYWVLNNATPNSTTDQGSNTVCFQPDHYSLDFGGQPVSTTSISKSITFYCNNTASCSSIGASLTTGTQYSIASNGCSATQSVGTNCTISLTFTPTTKDVQTDSLVVTSNMPSPANSLSIPLIGVGGLPASSTGVTPAPALGMFAKK